MISKVLTVAPLGFSGSLVEVESGMTNSLPSIQIVGMGNKAIDESKERVRSAIHNSMLDFPKKRILVNLAPAELPKDGSHYDLPIALSILISNKQLKQSEVSKSIFAGELSLDGLIRPIRGVLNIAEIAQEKHYKLYVPIANLQQARLIKNIEIFGVKSLKELYLHLKGEVPINNSEMAQNIQRTSEFSEQSSITIGDIIGQDHAKRAIVIAAAGRHNILISGSPGSGKTMLAKVLPELLPPLASEECVSITKLHNLAGTISDEIIVKRPFRSPHHTSSVVSIIGGGNNPKPGEISLSHLGVLLLDEMPEYPRSTLEALRQPMEDRLIHISRAKSQVTYPADFILIGTMNPCPCGYLGDSYRECTCTSTQILNYQKKISGPLLDRIDLFINITKSPNLNLLNHKSCNNSQHYKVKNQIDLAISTQRQRYKCCYTYNGTLTNKQVKQHIKLSNQSNKLLEQVSDKLHLTARSYFKIIKVARTIADLDQSIEILDNHILEALQYRQDSSIGK